MSYGHGFVATVAATLPKTAEEVRNDRRLVDVAHAQATAGRPGASAPPGGEGVQQFKSTK